MWQCVEETCSLCGGAECYKPVHLNMAHQHTRRLVLQARRPSPALVQRANVWDVWIRLTMPQSRYEILVSGVFEGSLQ